MSELIGNEKLLQRMRYDMYFNLSLKDISRILKSVNMARARGKTSSVSINAGSVVFKFTYPNNKDDVYDTVTFSYFNKVNRCFISSSEVIMEDLINSIKRVYARALKNL